MELHSGLNTSPRKQQWDACCGWLFNHDSRFTFVDYENAGHKLTVNKDSYDRIHDIMHHQMELDEGSVEYNILHAERLALITDLNYDVMNDILSFCNEIIQ